MSVRPPDYIVLPLYWVATFERSYWAVTQHISALDIIEIFSRIPKEYQDWSSMVYDYVDASMGHDTSDDLDTALLDLFVQDLIYAFYEEFELYCPNISWECYEFDQWVDRNTLLLRRLS